MMDSAMIAKISKAREYASEPERITISDFTVQFSGKHQTYRVGFVQGAWTCECDFFAQRGVCSHIMAVEKVLNRTGMMMSQPQPVTA
jgi:hypothetical protein